MTPSWTPIAVVYILIIAISLILCIFILLSLCLNRVNILKAADESKAAAIGLKITNWCILSYIAFDILVLIDYMLYHHASMHTLHSLHRKILNCLYVIIWEVSQALIYILLMLRVHHSFKNTKYAISKSVYIIFIISNILFCAISIAYVFHKLLEVPPDEEEQFRTQFTYSRTLDGVYQIGLELIDLFISILLILLFIKKMIDVTVDVQLSQLNKEKNVLLHITAKYFVLSFVATLWTQLVTFLYSVHWVFRRVVPELSADIERHIATGFWMMDGIVNPICLYLIFEVNDAYYQRLCGGCHAYSKLCFRKYTMRNVKRKSVHQSMCMDTELNMALLVNA